MDWHNPLTWLSPGIGFIAILVGIGAIIMPGQASLGFGVATSGSGLKYVRATGIRDIFLGLIFLLLSVKGDPHLLGYASLFTALVSTTDFFLTRLHGSKLASLIHGSATFVAVAYGAWLLSK